MNKPKLIFSSAYAAIITIIFVVVITIGAELSASLKDWLKSFSGHHWTSKSIFSVLLYAVATVVLYLSPYKYTDDHLKRILDFLLASAVLGTVILTLFFMGHHFRLF
ncbi:MAG: hypothetical protein NUV81_00575 [bacterium]|nr:hypothetical protein [bacterium]